MSGVPPEAPLARRLAALAYEGTLYAALILVAGFLTLPLVSVASAAPSELRIPDGPARILSLAVFFAAGALFYAWSWTGGRRTLPMKTWRLRLVRVDGRAPDSRTALLRYFAVWIGPLLALLAYVVLRRWGLGAHAVWLLAFNFLWAFVDRNGRFLHDRVAGTRIIIS